MPSPRKDTYTILAKGEIFTSVASPTNCEDIFVVSSPRPKGAIGGKELDQFFLRDIYVWGLIDSPPGSREWVAQYERRWEEYGEYVHSNPVKQERRIIRLPSRTPEGDYNVFKCKKCGEIADSLSSHFIFKGIFSGKSRWVCKNDR